MARRARLNILARRRLPRLLRQLEKPLQPWPKHLAAARRILHQDLKLPIAQARKVIRESVEAGHNWVVAQDRLCREIAELNSRTDVRLASLRISNCIKRGPAGLRKRLNEAIFALLQNTVIDLEIISLIFNDTTSVLLKFPADKSALTARKAMRKIHKADYSSLGAARGEAEKAVTTWAPSTTQENAAKDFYAILGRSLNSKNPPKDRINLNALTIEYVRSIAASWRRVGLKATRGSSPYNPAYRTKFHLFAELVLTAMAEPWALRHDTGLDTLRRRIKEAHERAPDDFRRDVSADLRRSDREWLVDTYHIRIATCADSNFRSFAT